MSAYDAMLARTKRQGPATASGVRPNEGAELLGVDRRTCYGLMVGGYLPFTTDAKGYRHIDHNAIQRLRALRDRAQSDDG